MQTWKQKYILTDGIAGQGALSPGQSERDDVGGAVSPARGRSAEPSRSAAQAAFEGVLGRLNIDLGDVLDGSGAGGNVPRAFTQDSPICIAIKNIATLQRCHR